MSGAFETQEWESLESMEGSGEWESQAWGGEQFLGEMETSSESQEAELAAELLEISGEEELEQFLGNLIRGAAKAVGGFVRSPVGRALGGALKNIAKTALPAAAGALGNLVLPGVGGVIGSKLGSMATNLFEVELEGMNEQEAEFEVARRYVRFATAAARNAARAPSGAPPRSVARAAITAAARRHAPGLLHGSRPGRRPGGPRPRPRRGGYGFPYYDDGYYYDGDDGPAYYGGDQDGDDDGGTGSGGDDGLAGRAHSGRWVRRGRKIVILGA